MQYCTLLSVAKELHTEHTQLQGYLHECGHVENDPQFTPQCSEFAFTDTFKVMQHVELDISAWKRARHIDSGVHAGLGSETNIRTGLVWANRDRFH